MEPEPSPPGTCPELELPFSPEALPRSRTRHVRPVTSSSSRDGDTPHAVPATTFTKPPSRAEILADLTSRIRIIEQRGAAAAPDRALPALRPARETQTWCLGAPEIDRRLGPGGLETGALHEIKPALDTGSPFDGNPEGSDWTGSVTAAISFALGLSQRRRIALEAAREARPTPPPGPMLWCSPLSISQEIGRPYPDGLTAFGIDPADLIVVEPDKTADVLWTLEESLKAGSLHLVLGVVRDVELTPARRLALAAAARGTPCLLVTDPRGPETAATSTRWRIARALSAGHPFADRLDENPPGAPRYRVILERCRTAGLKDPVSPLVLEWSDATHRFSLASASSDRADIEVRARRHRR